MSSQINDFTAFQSAIARIYRPNVDLPNEGVVGAGFLISPQYMLTCAHVVTSALNIATETTAIPTQSVDVDFPLTAPGEKLKAKVVFWRPVQSVTATPSDRGEDIAVLELEGEPPKEAQPARITLIEEANLWDHSFRVLGFPAGNSNGSWATGVLRGKQAQGWIQVEDEKNPGYRIKPGFSGAPVWDINLASIVGITVAAEKDEEVKAAFIIPTKVLRKQVPDNFLSLSDKTISRPTVDERYQPIIRAFTSGNIIPFLGAGIHLCDRSQGMTIGLALRLAQVYNPQGQLLGLPCSVCPLPLESSWPPPRECPLWQRLPKGQETNNVLTCPLSNEQRLALAKMNLRFLSQYVSFLEGGDLYGALHFHLDEIYGELLQDKTNPHRLHEFLARLRDKKSLKSYLNLIVTTNYDETLERIFDQVGQPYDVVFYVAEGDDRGKFKHKTHKGEIKATPIDPSYKLPWGERPIILKLYGTWQHEFVITEEHYINYLVGCSIDQVLSAELVNAVKNSKILFLGYSLNDPDLQVVLNRFWKDQPLKNARGINSWIVHQYAPGQLEEKICADRRVELIESSIEDLITNLEMGIEQLPIA